VYILVQAKQTVEGTRFISVDDIKELEADSTYILKWHDEESINIDKHKDHAVLRYMLGDERIRVYVGLDKTKVGYGYRSWLICPACGRRTAKLYNVSGVFACRKCNNLTYMTCQASGNRLEYLAIKIRRLQHRLGVDISDINCDIQEKPLFKPKNMHQKTYWILKTQLGIMQMHFIDEWLKSVRG